MKREPSTHATKILSPVAACLPLLVLWVCGGCATAKIAGYDTAGQVATERKAEKSGLEVAFDPFVETSRTEQYFDINALGEGIAILHARITNDTTNQTFLVEKKNIQLIPAGTNSFINSDEKGIQRSQAGANTLTVVGAVGIGLGGLATAPAGLVLALAGAAMTSHSTEVQRNFIDKEMPDQTLAPGESMEGFIYFTPIKKGEDWSRTMSVKLCVNETTTHEATELDLPLTQ